MAKMNFLMPLKGTATKEFLFLDGIWTLSKSYQSGKYYKGIEVEVESLEDVATTLEECQDHPFFTICGAFIEGIDKSKMIRRKRRDHKDGLPPTITDRNIQVLCLDVDKFDGLDKDLTGKEAVEAFVSLQLPEPFQKASVVYQFSSSYGLTTDKFNCHLFFWLKIPAHNLDIRTWIKAYNAAKGWKNTLDPSILLPSQPIYTQRRICHGAEDPVVDFAGFIDKGMDLIWDPKEIAEIETPAGEKRTIMTGLQKEAYDLSGGVEKILISENYHDELNKLALSLINRKVPPGTVKDMLEGAMNAAKRDLTDPERIADWQTRFDDIGRSVDSAVEIVGNLTIEEVLCWIQEEDTPEVKANFARMCLPLSPMDRTTAIAEISKKIGFGVRDIKATIKNAEEEAKALARVAALEARSREREERGIYEIEITASTGGEAAKKAGDILAKSEHKPEVYSMGGSLASVVLGVPKTIRQCCQLAEMGVDYPKIPIIQHYRKPFYTLGGRLESDIIFINEDGKDIEAPTRVLHMIGEATNIKFKPLTGIVEHPFIDRSWKLIQEEGYNETTGLYTMLHHKLKVKRMTPKAAYKYLAYTVFDEFPFNAELDRAVAVAALLTGLQRPTIAGDSGMPGFGIVSPIQSSGKTTLAQLISYSIFNRPVAASSWSNDDEELGKHILAILQEGHSCVLFDNIKQGSSIQSGRLAAAMSSDIFGGRQLGENKTIEVPSSVVWLFTGNGIHFVGDFATRIYPIIINPNMENPNVRKFKRENIGQWAMDNRKKIISALLSIIIGGKKADPPKESSRFKLWDEFVRNPLLCASGIDINDAIANNQTDDPIQMAKHNLLVQLKEVFGEKEFSTKDIIKKAFNAFETEETDLASALEEVIGDKIRNAISIGRYMMAMSNVVIGKVSLKKRNTNIVMWRIEDVKN